MKLYSLAIYYKKSESEAKILKGAQDLQSFSFYQRGSVQEFMGFTGRIIVERSAQPSRSSVKEQDYLCHAYVRADGLSAVLICDTEYPQRVAFTLLAKVLDDFAEKVPSPSWPTVTEGEVVFGALPATLARYQNPKEADALSKLHGEIDETKIVVVEAFDQLLKRGEKLDDLVEKSDELSRQSQMFFKQARKMNKCCSWV